MRLIPLDSLLQVGAIIVFLSSACQSVPEPKQVKEAHIVAYSIEKGQWNETSHEAIPQQAAFINYKDSQGNVHRKHRFNLWDINQDKRPDMVEVLDLEGKIIQRIYDFNFDGQPDKIENASE